MENSVFFGLIACKSRCTRPLASWRAAAQRVITANDAGSVRPARASRQASIAREVAAFIVTSLDGVTDAVISQRAIDLVTR